MQAEEFTIKHYLAGVLLLAAMTSYGAVDPTTPSDWDLQGTSMHPPKDIILSGIFIHENQNTAVINNKSVREGDFIRGYEVIKISKGAVYLKNLQGTVVVPLNAKVLTPPSERNERSEQGSAVK